RLTPAYARTLVGPPEVSRPRRVVAVPSADGAGLVVQRFGALGSEHVPGGAGLFVQVVHEISRVIDGVVARTGRVPAVMSTVLRGIRGTDRVRNRHPDALVAGRMVQIDVQHAGLTQTTVILPRVGQNAELLPAMAVGRRTLGNLREHDGGIRKQTGTRIAMTAAAKVVVPREEVLDVRARRELAVRHDLRVLERMTVRETVLRRVAGGDFPTVGRVAHQ